ncbi:MAG: ABC transporter ATP-binding protein/permease [Chloroflexaceae bacterium]|jgi:ATP-binding cassette subfamily B protein|nr:ABC transporter ATP-binding protein/permease [Chloroflexaceae bacterium]
MNGSLVERPPRPNGAAHYNGRRPIRTLAALYRDDWPSIAWALVFYVIKHSPTFFIPVLTARIIDLVANRDPRLLLDFWITGGLMLVLVAQNAPMNYAHARFLSRALRNVELKLRAAICQRLQQLSIGFYQRHPSGALQAKVLRDVEQLELMTRQVLRTLPAVVLGVSIAVVMISLRAPWFLVFFLLAVPAAALTRQVFRRRMAETNRAFRTEIEGMAGQLIEMIRLIPVTRAHGVENDELERVERRLNEVRASALRLDGLDAMFGGLSWVTLHLASAICLICAGYIYYTQALPITIGDVVLLTGLFSALIDAVLKLVELVPQIGRGVESLRSIGEVLESPDLEHNAGKRLLPALHGAVAFQQVHYQYPQSGLAAVTDVSFHATPGTVTAFVGPSGAGKSTLLQLLIGFARPSAGQVTIDQHDINGLDMRAVRQSVAVVAQETLLFSGTIRENVTYGASDVDESRLLAALRDANALEFVERLQQGVDTLIGENGARLSGGQKQRLAIARALLRDPRLLILDEPTSALDADSEALIQQALARLMQGRTTFIVAHRLATVRAADQIIVLDGGRVVETGNHLSLLARGGVYARMCALQALD